MGAQFLSSTGLGTGNSQGEHNSPQHPHWIKIGLPNNKAFSSKRNLFFMVKGPGSEKNINPPPQIPRRPPDPLPGNFNKTLPDPPSPLLARPLDHEKKGPFWMKMPSMSQTLRFTDTLSFGFGKRGLWKRGLFRTIHFLEILENLEILEMLAREPPDCGKQRRLRPFSRDSREFRDFRNSRDSSSEKTPFVMTPFSGPESWHTSFLLVMVAVICPALAALSAL